MANPLQQVNRALAPIARQLPRWPWYTWGGLGVGLVLLVNAFGSKGPPTAPLPPPASPKGPMPTIKLGSTGSAVSVWQKIVGATVNGVFDQATKTKTIAWQAAHPAAGTPDGIVGPATWTAAGYPTGSTTPIPGGTNPPDIGTTPVPGTDFQLSNNFAQRESQILGAILDGNYDIEWVPVQLSDSKGNTATVNVTRRALRLAYGPARLTVNGSFWAQQQAADMLGAAMLTTKVSDAIWDQADRKLPVLSRPITNTTAALVDQSAKIDAALDAAGGDADHLLVANEGKDWVLTRRFWPPPSGINSNPTAPEGATGSPHNSANFGWYPGGSKSPSGKSVIQSIGLAHNKGNAPGIGHSDYCLAEGTLVDTPTGHVAIEKLKTGDLVFTYNHQRTRPDVSRVEATMVTGSQSTLVVELDNGERVRCTANHRWLLVDGSEREAGLLESGDRLLALRRSHAGADYETLYSRSSHRYSYTHRAIACAKERQPYGVRGLVAHHKDEDKRNNHPDNLELITRKGHAQEHIENVYAQWQRPETRAAMREGISRRFRERLAAAGTPYTMTRCPGCNVAFHRSASHKPIYCSRKCYWDVRMERADLNHKVALVERDGLVVPTYDIEVERDHNFALTAGVFVHNSQLWRFMRKEMTVNGQPTTVAEVLADPNLSSVLQDEGGTMLADKHPDYENVVA